MRILRTATAATAGTALALCLASAPAAFAADASGTAPECTSASPTAKQTVALLDSVTGSATTAISQAGGFTADFGGTVGDGDYAYEVDDAQARITYTDVALGTYYLDKATKAAYEKVTGTNGTYEKTALKSLSRSSAWVKRPMGSSEVSASAMGTGMWDVMAGGPSLLLDDGFYGLDDVSYSCVSGGSTLTVKATGSGEGMKIAYTFSFVYTSASEAPSEASTKTKVTYDGSSYATSWTSSFTYAEPTVTLPTGALKQSAWRHAVVASNVPVVRKKAVAKATAAVAKYGTQAKRVAALRTAVKKVATSASDDMFLENVTFRTSKITRGIQITVKDPASTKSYRVKIVVKGKKVTTTTKVS